MIILLCPPCGGFFHVLHLVYQIRKSHRCKESYKKGTGNVRHCFIGYHLGGNMKDGYYWVKHKFSSPRKWEVAWVENSKYVFISGDEMIWEIEDMFQIGEYIPTPDEE